MTVVRAKISVPPLPVPLVQRPRVEGLIADLIERHRALLVTATAGAGKTTAVIGATKLVDRPMAWLTVDDTDAAPGRLLTYLEAAVATLVPRVKGIAASALAGGVPHREVAGVLAEAVSGESLLLVLDELERLTRAPAALSVIDGYLRYAPPDTRVVLISRHDPPIDVSSLLLARRAARVGEGQLAFTVDEAAAALAAVGASWLDPAQVIEQTGGWVAGVLFESYRSADVIAEGGGADPLHGYLSRNILEELEPEERDLLIETALLDVVTPDRASALGVKRAPALLASLRAKHLPATWQIDPQGMRCHPRFREYLLDLLSRSDEARVESLRLAQGHLLEREGHDEDAVEAFLAAGAPDEALEAAERCIVSVVERLDFSVAERWLAALADVRSDWSPGLTTAELLLAVRVMDFRRGAEIGDRLAQLGLRDRLAAHSPMAAALMGWSYYSAAGRVEDTLAVLDAAGPDPETAAVRSMLTFASDDPCDGELEPTLGGGPLDALTMGLSYYSGHLTRLAEEPSSPWAAQLAEPWRIAALTTLGLTSRALELFERACPPNGWLMAAVGADLMHDLGREPESRELLALSRAHLRHSGSTVAHLHSKLLEAKLDLRFGGTAHVVRRRLTDVEREAREANNSMIVEQAQTWHGLALLLDGADDEALGKLRQAVASMTRSGRTLLLPVAGVYLAEASWRAGDEEGADQAIDVALKAATTQGSNHLLIQGLTDFPAVLSRRLDAEPDADSDWHAVGRALRAAETALELRAGATLTVLEFGQRSLLLRDSPVKAPRLTKSHLLLAYLATCPGREAPRRSVLDALFERGTDDSNTAYLRQAVRSARDVLPPEFELVLDVEQVRLRPADSLTSESVRFQTMLSDAANLIGKERLDLLLAALEIYGQGMYLPGAEGTWVDERRRCLDDLAEQASVNAAHSAYDAGHYGDAERLARAALARNRFREGTWRLLMRIASVRGDDDAVIAAYRSSEKALAEIGAKPAASTRKLLSQLRR